MKIIFIKNVNNEEIDCNLEPHDALHIKDTNNSYLFLHNKFNKLVIDKSNEIYIEIDKIITSVEINNCNNIFIKAKDSGVPFVPCIELFKSSLYLVGDIELYKPILIVAESSSLYNI
jgi:hypothetical protein